MKTRDIADAVRRGLGLPHKSLAPFLFYDAQGSALFEEITALPEYYPTRTERGILEKDAPRIVERSLAAAESQIAILELGAGTATKTEVLLHEYGGARPNIRYFPADVSPTPLEEARQRMRTTCPDLTVTPIVGTHVEALQQLAHWEGTLIVLFLGSSIGNYEDREASALLTDVGAAMRKSGVLILGVDRVKPRDVLVPAYDDRAGVTAAFNLNVLARINRELGGEFDLATFRHVAVWNESASAMEMYLESAVAQHVKIASLDVVVDFAEGERIHTESSHKYTPERVETLLASAKLRGIGAFEDAKRWFGVHLAVAR